MSLIIDISNYESYVMDYIDGELTPEDKAHFDAFLLKHPEVALEVEDLMDYDYSIVDNETNFNSSSLKLEVTPIAGIDESNYEEAMAFSVDSDLVPEQKAQLDAFVEANPFLKRDAILYGATKLTPSSELVFEAKSNLKKPVPLFAQPSAVYRIAAAVLVLFGILGLLNNIQTEEYSPRKGELVYASLSMEFPMTYSSTSKVNSAISHSKVSATVAKATRSDVPLMDMHRANRLWEPQPIVERERPSLALALPTAYPELLLAQNERSPELNITQFVGSEILGLSPEKTQTTRSLLKESAKKVIDQSEQFALNTESNDKNKKTFSLLAAAVEFKRVTYN